MQAREHILRFLEEVKPLALHGFEIRQGGEMIAKGSSAPFQNSQPHRLYSVSKSVVSLAIGILISEGKLRLDEKILPYFEDYLPEKIPEELDRLTIRDLLRMATCYDKTTYRPLTDDNWTKPFFEGTPQHASGTIFTYDTGASQVLSSLVERLRGESLLTFVNGRLFAPIGISDRVDWLRDHCGNPQGGTGLIMSLDDFACLTDFCMSDGRGLIDPDYLNAATSFQIATDTSSMPEERYGYGYFFWRTRNGFAMYGMGGQMGICFPETGLALTTTADLILNGTGVQPIYDAFFRHLAPMRAEHCLMNDPEIRECIANMSFPPIRGERPQRKSKIHLQTPISPVTDIMIYGDMLILLTEHHQYPLTVQPGTWQENMFPPIGKCLAGAAMVSPGEYRAQIELTDWTCCAIHLAVSFGQDNRATVRITSSTWECVEGYSGTALGIVQYL